MHCYIYSSQNLVGIMHDLHTVSQGSNLRKVNGGGRKAIRPKFAPALSKVSLLMRDQTS